MFNLSLHEHSIEFEFIIYTTLEKCNKSIQINDFNNRVLSKIISL